MRRTRLRPIAGDRASHNRRVTITDERRLVTVLFVDLVGFTGRAEQADPEAVREIQRAYFAAVTEQVVRFGGSLEKYIGDAAMATFGAPQAHDDDAERALRSALEIRKAVAELEGDLEVRIGVDTGEVVGGTGGPQEGDYTVSGDAVNVAARLQQTAAPGEILVGGMTRRLSADAFAFAPLDEMTVKGRTEPIEPPGASSASCPERPRSHGGEARLVGRARELAALESALEEARDGRGLMVALVGEPGIGKSRLALEMRQRAEAAGFVSAWTSSRSYASAFPYHLLSQLVTELLDLQAGQRSMEALRAADVDADEAALARWAAVLDEVLGEGHEDDPLLADLSPAGRQRIAVHAIGGLLRAASQREPMLVVLDDLHWADPASLAVIEELLDILPGLRVVLLATYRSNWSHGWEGRSAYEQLNLRALRPEDARLIAQELAAGREVSTELTERVLERSAGNPLSSRSCCLGSGGRVTASRIGCQRRSHRDALGAPGCPLHGDPTHAPAGLGHGDGVLGGNRGQPLGARRSRNSGRLARPPAGGARGRGEERPRSRVPPSPHPRGRVRQPAAQHAARAAPSDRGACASRRAHGADGDDLQPRYRSRRCRPACLRIAGAAGCPPPIGVRRVPGDSCPGVHARVSRGHRLLAWPVRSGRTDDLDSRHDRRDPVVDRHRHTGCRPSAQGVEGRPSSGRFTRTRIPRNWSAGSRAGGFIVLEELELYAVDRRLVGELAARLDRRTAFGLSISEGDLYVSIGTDTLTGGVVRHRIG